ncbi:MAG: FAD-dependent oxidoreductase [Caulobacteraceae bacterium]
MNHWIGPRGWNGVGRPLDIAVVGTGISGMAAAWLLSSRHRVTIYEAGDRVGGHSNTVQAPDGRGGTTPVDTGFIVYNEANYPNLTALLRGLSVPTQSTDMSFSVSLDGGRLEYGSTGLDAVFAQPANLLRPRFWSMLLGLRRFYAEAAERGRGLDPHLSIGQFLEQEGYGPAFIDDHLMPQAGAIWSATPDAIRDYPAAAFIRFFDNHGLLKISTQTQWRTIVGGAQAYIEPLTAPYADRIRLNCPVRAIRRSPAGVMVRDAGGHVASYDHVVVAAHANQALAMLEDPTPQEAGLLGAFAYNRNLAVLHNDVSLMPRRRRAWAAWNHVGKRGGASCITYWMNRLQQLETAEPLLVTLDPVHAPRPDAILRSEVYEHPIFNAATAAAQRRLWSLQGVGNTWFCGAYFGAGFHEDGLQAGLAVAEQLGGALRPWTVAAPSGRIHVAPEPAAGCSEEELVA